MQPSLMFRALQRLTLALLFSWSSQSEGTTIWKGGAGNNNWSNPQNWVGGLIPSNDGTADILLSGPVFTTPNIDAPWTVRSLVFDSFSGEFVVGGSSLSIGTGGVFQGSTLHQIFNQPVLLTASQVWSFTAGGLDAAGPVDIGANTLTVTGGKTGQFSGGITGSGALIVSMSPTAVFICRGMNTLSGGVFINQGSFYVNEARSLGAASAPVTLNGGTLALAFPGVMDRNIYVAEGGGRVHCFADVTLSTEISGVGSISFSGSGRTVQLTGENTYSGGTRIAGGLTLVGTTSSIQGDCFFAGTGSLIFNQSSAGVFEGDLSGSGGVYLRGDGMIRFAGNNSHSGVTQIESGGIEISAGSTNLAPQSCLRFSGDTAVLQVVGGGTFARAVTAQAGGVYWDSAGGFAARNGRLTVDLGGGLAEYSLKPHRDLTFGSPTANSITEFRNPISLGQSDTSPAPAIRVNAGAGGDRAIISGIISGGNRIEKKGTGILELTANSTYTGPTIVSSGTLIISGSLAKTSIAVQGGASVGGTGTLTGNITVAGGNNSTPRGSLSFVDGKIGTLTFASLSSSETVLSLGGTAGRRSNLLLEVGESSDLLHVLHGRVSVLVGGAHVTIYPLSGFAPGTYDLLTFPNGQASGLNLLTLSNGQAAGYQLSLQATSHSLQLVVVPEPSALALLLFGSNTLLRRWRRGRITHS